MADLPPPLTGVVTHADHGEDVILRVMFDRLGIEKPSYLDLGARQRYETALDPVVCQDGANRS